MAKKTTSLRLPDELRDALAEAARRRDTTVSALIERYAREGLAIDGHPGVVFRSGPSGRRAALAAGPDVWEVVARLRELEGTEDERVSTLSEESSLHPRQILIALSYAAEHPDEIEERIAANERALEEARRTHEARDRLLDSA